MTPTWALRVVEDVQRAAAAGDEAHLVRVLLSGHGGADAAFVTAVRALSPDLRARLVPAVLAGGEDPLDRAWALALLTHDLDGALTPQDLAPLLTGTTGQWTVWRPHRLAGCVELARRAGVEVPRDLLEAARRSLALERYDRGTLPAVLAGVPAPVLNRGEAWSDAVLAGLPALGAGWAALLEHAVTATAARPTARWEARARQLLADVDGDPRPVLRDWLALVGRPRTAPLERRAGDYDVNQALDPHNADALRGLVQLLALLPADPATARTLGALVETAVRKVPGLGPRSPKLAGAAVHALARLDGPDAVAQLARLAARVTYRTTLALVGTALDERAAALGLTRAEVEELAVPGYGFGAVGRREVQVGGATATLTVVGGDVRLTWRNPAGAVVRSVPAVVRREHPEELRELKGVVKDVTAMLSAQSERLDRQFLARRSWPWSAWRERLLDHPLVGTLARRLVWVVDGRACAWTGGTLRTLDGTPLEAAADAGVTLWHPVGRDVAEVLAWRERLAAHEVVQPFKQVHREVHLLTDAERATGTYSNRFAAHVLRQHQVGALAAVRGWTHRLRLLVDDSFPPLVRELPEWGLRAEFWVEGAGDRYGEDTDERGTHLRLSTDQVRFHRAGAPPNFAHAAGGGYEQRQGPAGQDRSEREAAGPVPLLEVPALVLSEVLRDVDLFVGVASVGNDPTWQDGGPQGRHREYWRSFNTGELSATAATRRDLLARLVPRLAIADRCSVQERFLVVRGDLRTYRIHLGSGNVVMDPGEEYLCIVPAQHPGPGRDGLFLPFEGDRTLDVVLSKAVLLAGDAAITDPTITSQIHRGR